MTSNSRMEKSRLGIGTSKIDDPVYRGGNHKSLAFMLKSGSPAKLTVILKRNFWQTGQTEFRYEVVVPSIEGWSRITVSPGDFKDDKGNPLDNWEKLNRLSFIGEFPPDKPMAIGKVEWSD